MNHGTCLQVNTKISCVLFVYFGFGFWLLVCTDWLKFDS